jgi:metal-responsive CopG/Arc/MetJ family transcriptional regulator
MRRAPRGSRTSCDQRGHTPGTKTAVSIPDDLFEQAEEPARRSTKSRSQLFADALPEYVARHDPDAVTAALDRIVEQLEEPRDDFVSVAARRVLERSDW